MSFLRATQAARSLNLRAAAPAFSGVRLFAASHGIKVTDNSQPSVLRTIEDNWESARAFARLVLDSVVIGWSMTGR